MDIEEILQKVIKFLSDPRGREIVKTFLYLFFPLLILLIIRNAARRRTASAEKTSAALVPKMRPTATEIMHPAESFKETKARERKKIDKELQVGFGHEQNVLTRARKNLTRSGAKPESRPAESPESDEKKMLQAELLKLFSRRQK